MSFVRLGHYDGRLLGPTIVRRRDGATARRRDDVVVGASILQSVGLGFISQVDLYQKTLKTVFTASLLGAQHKRDSVENKPASLLLCS